MRRCRWLFVVAVAACGGNGETTITVRANHADGLAVKHGDGAWQSVDIEPTGEAFIEATGDFVVARLCGQILTTDFNYFAIYAGLGADVLDMRCASEPVMITAGASSAPYVIMLGGEGGLGGLSGGTPTFIDSGTSKPIFPNRHDLVAINQDGGEPRFEIRHDVDLTQSTTVTFDLANAQPLRAVTVQPEAGVAAIAGTLLVTERRTRVGTVMNANGQHAFPSSGIGPGDRSFAIVQTTEIQIAATLRRLVGTRMTDDQTNIVVPVGPNLEVPVMRWDEFMPAGRWSWPAELADWTHAYVRVVHDGAPIVIDAELLPSWSGSRPDELAIPDPRDIPFYSPDWEPLLTPHRYTWLIDVMRETDSELRVLSAEEHL